MALKQHEQDLLDRVQSGLGIGGAWEPSTTGATLEELARTLKDVGAVSVENRVVARTPAPA